MKIKNAVHSTLTLVKEKRHQLTLAVYLLLGFFSTWQWQEATERDLDCRFDRIDHRLATLESNLMASNARLGSSILLSIPNSNQEDKRFINDIVDANSNLARASEKFEKSSEYIQKNIDVTCSRLSQIGWSFLALSMFAGFGFSMMTANLNNKLASNRSVRRNKRA